jgi:hypothetical protein
MYIVISEPWEKDGSRAVYLVDHETKIKEDFEGEWDEIKDAVKKADPENWNVSEILVKLKRRGWKILHVTPINVDY